LRCRSLTSSSPTKSLSDFKQCLLVALSGHSSIEGQCLLSGVERILQSRARTPGLNWTSVQRDTLFPSESWQTVAARIRSGRRSIAQLVGTSRHFRLCSLCSRSGRGGPAIESILVIFGDGIGQTSALLIRTAGLPRP
jgi:hypothetical protein